MAKNSLNDIILECYREVYKQTTPPADIDEIIKSGEGNQERWFMNYEISEHLYNEIITSVIMKHKLTKWQKAVIERSCLLGCSPKFSGNDTNYNWSNTK